MKKEYEENVITKKEAQEFLDYICSRFKVLAKCNDCVGMHDVDYLEVNGSYIEERDKDDR